MLNRKGNRLSDFDYSQNGYYFVTICTKNRKEFFGDIRDGKMILNGLGQAVQKCWLDIPIHFPNATLDEYVVMPNHIHGILVIENSDSVGNNNHCSLQDQNASWQTRLSGSLSSMIRGFKIGVKKRCIANGKIDFAWQRSFYDHIIRNEKSLDKIRQYISDNPAQWEFDRNNPKYLYF
jgi:REP element-mobilizing transposase RayT